VVFLVITQNANRQLATSSENLVASAQFLVALATSELQFRALHYHHHRHHHHHHHALIIRIIFVEVISFTDIK